MTQKYTGRQAPKILAIEKIRTDDECQQKDCTRHRQKAKELETIPSSNTKHINYDYQRDQVVRHRNHFSWAEPFWFLETDTEAIRENIAQNHDEHVLIHRIESQARVNRNEKQLSNQ